MTNEHCNIEGCDKKVAARGMCWKHYQRVRRHGDPHALRPRGGYHASWVDPLTDDDYDALHRSVEADAQRLLPLALSAVWNLIGRAEPPTPPRRTG